MTSRSRLTPWMIGMVLALTLVPGVAFAAGPTTVPRTIISEGFEVGTTPSYVVTALSQPTSATWAPVARAHTGARGLWCAGSTGLGSVYPRNTFSYAVFQVPQTADYYASEFTFWYWMPSIGAQDQFQPAWERVPADGIDPIIFPPVVTSWTQSRVDMAAGPQSISRRPGTVSFKFDDLYAPFGAATGEGPTIDDVVISGWKYGPVRNLTSSVGTDKVGLSWDRPYRAADSTEPEERPISYRVWRAPTGTTLWSELTASPITDASLSSSRPTAGPLQTYAVQPVDTGGGYGQVSTKDVTIAGVPNLVPALTFEVKPTTVDYGASATFSGTLTTSGQALAGLNVQLQYYASGWKTLATKKTDAAGKVVFWAKPYNKNKTRFRMTFSAPGFNTISTAEKTVTPRPYVGVPTKPKVAYKYKTFTVKASLNPRHKAGTYPVKIKCYRYESGKWVYRKGFWAKAYDYSSYSRVYAKVKLPYRGTWKMRAYAPADTLHAYKYGGYTSTFKVK